MVAALVSVAACGSPLVSPSTGQLPTKGNPNCPNVASNLLALTQAGQPLDAARSLGIPVKNGKIQVVLGTTLEGNPDLPRFGVEVTSRSEGQAQAFVPVDQICALARSGDVTFVRLAQQAVPQQ